MKIDPITTRTYSNPTAGVSFSAKDEVQINILAQGLAQVDGPYLTVVRSALAREIIYLEQLSDWTIGEMEAERRHDLELALLTYQATYVAKVIKNMTRRATCDCRCMRGENCGGCGHEGCGFRAETKS